MLLTPGPFNSAYYEHSFLADEMGIELVEGADLLVEDDIVYMRTTEGLQRVDVIYRRIDDDFLDPLTFRPDSLLGVPGPHRRLPRRQRHAWPTRSAPASPTTRRSIPIVPEMIRFYLGEEPILKNVPTYRCAEADDLAYVLDHLAELVVKETRGSGGYGMLVGPARERAAERAAFAEKLQAHGRPTTSRSRRSRSRPARPSSRQGIAPRHVDLRPFVLTGREIRIVPGGLTRVALREGLAGGQLEPGRRHQGHLGAGGLTTC